MAKRPKDDRPRLTEGKPRAKKKRLNISEKEERTAAEWRRFIKLVGRKAQRGREPNDRKHSKDADIALRRIRPEDFDRIIRFGDREED
jgi:hypothetical protein